MAAKSNSKIKSLIQQVKEKEELLSEFQVKMKVANSKLSMYREGNVMSQQLMLQYHHFYSGGATKAPFHWKGCQGLHTDVYSSHWPTIFPQTVIVGATILPQNYALFSLKMLQNRG